MRSEDNTANRPSPTERRVALLTPAAGWPQTEFEEYWLHQHGKIVATTPGYGRFRADYVQDHVIRGDLGLEPFPFAGVASVRMPAHETPNFADTELFRNRILPDEEHFLDRSACVALRVAEERVVAGAGPVSCLAFGAHEGSAGNTGSTGSTPWYVSKKLDAAIPQPRSVVRGSLVAAPTDLSGRALAHAPRLGWVEETEFATEQDALDHFAARCSLMLDPPLWAFLSERHVLFGTLGPSIP